MVYGENYSFNTYCKSTIDFAQLNHRLELATDGIEIQLLTEFEDINLYNKAMADLSDYAKYNIRVVHSPFLKHKHIKGMEESTLEYYVYTDRELMRRFLTFSEELAKLKNSTILIVFHLDLSYEVLDKYDFYKDYRKFFEEVLRDYPHLEFGLENLTLFSTPGEDYLASKGNFDFSAARLAERLRADLRTSRIGTVLDTCHAGMVAKYVNDIYDTIMQGAFPKPDFSFENYFKNFKDSIKLVHLAYFDGCGFGRYHGQPFNYATLPVLKEILALYRKYEYLCPVTLEVCDQSYTDCKNYRQMLSMLSMLNLC